MQIETFPVGAFDTNCYVLWNTERRAIVVDPGAGDLRILDFLRERKLTVASYLLTHGHMDHICALAAMHKAAPAPAAMHSADLAWAFNASNAMPPYYPRPERPACEIELLEDGARRSDGALPMEVLWTPGHSPGSVCLHFAAEKTLITGDTLFYGSVGRTDFPGGDARALTRSLMRLAKLPDDTRIYAGHGPASSIGEEKRTNPFMRFR
jgi:hydroxyacylglutathione hydrolase